MHPDLALSRKTYVPPEWVLIVAVGPMADRADLAIQAEDTNVRRADDLPTFELLVDQRLPVLGMIDLDAPIGAEVVARLLFEQVPMVLLSDSQAKLDEYAGLVPTLVQKPFSPRGIQKIVNGMLGRR